MRGRRRGRERGDHLGAEPVGPTEARTQAPGRFLGSFVFRAGALSLGAQAAVSPGRFGCGRKPPPSVTRAPWTRRLSAQSSCDPAVATLLKRNAVVGRPRFSAAVCSPNKGPPHQKSYRPSSLLFWPSAAAEATPTSKRSRRTSGATPTQQSWATPAQSAPLTAIYGLPTTAASRSLCVRRALSARRRHGLRRTGQRRDNHPRAPSLLRSLTQAAHGRSLVA